MTARNAPAGASSSPGGYGVAVLLLSMGCSFGNYFCYDNPAALMPYFMSQLCGGATWRYLLLYSVYSMPNTVLPFIGGYIVDQILGLRRAPALFCALIAVGSGFVALAAAAASKDGGGMLPFHIALLGRFIFGLGGECNQVSVNAIIAKWFKGRQLSTVYALSLCFSRCGSAANFALMPFLAAAVGFQMALFTTFIICILSFGAALLLWVVDRKGEAQGLVTPIKPCGVISFRDLKQVLERRQVLLYLICPFFYICIMTFISLAPRYFQEAWSLSSQQATSLCAVPYVISALLSPVFGIFADRIGRPLLFLLASTVGLALVHTLACFGLVPPMLMVSCLGVLFAACAATLWPMVALVVSAEYLGSAYGIMTAFQNIGIALAPLIIGGLNAAYAGTDSMHSVLLAQQVFAVSALCSLFCSIALFLTESADSPLLLSPAQLASRNCRVISMTRSPVNGWISGPLALIRSSALLMSPSQLVPRFSPSGRQHDIPASQSDEVSPRPFEDTEVIDLSSPLLDGSSSSSHN